MGYACKLSGESTKYSECIITGTYYFGCYYRATNTDSGAVWNVAEKASTKSFTITIDLIHGTYISKGFNNKQTMTGNTGKLSGNYGGTYNVTAYGTGRVNITSIEFN